MNTCISIPSRRLEITKSQFLRIKHVLLFNENRIPVAFEAVCGEWKSDEHVHLLYFIERVANGFAWHDGATDKLISA